MAEGLSKVRRPVFLRDQLRPGMILHGRDMRPGRTFGRMIRTVLTRGLRMEEPTATACWGNHDGLVVPDGKGGLGIGDSQPMRARVTALDEYERRMALGEYAVRILWPKGMSERDGSNAADWWLHFVKGTWYDLRAFPWLLAKSLLQDKVRTVRNWRWAYWCTEGVRTAWASGAGADPWENNLPTPLTTEKRTWPHLFDVLGGATFVDVTERVVVNARAWRYENGEWRERPAG